MEPYYKPGDRTPEDHERSGDAEKLAYSPLRAGDRAPEEHATDVDHARFGREFIDEDTGPLGGVAGLHFSAPFIQRPVATFLLSAAIILAGAVAYALLPVSSLPQVEYPTISVNASFPGADPETMASAIATPLERQFSRIAGITQMTSNSSLGSAGINMQFDLDRDVNGAARDVQAAINAARSQLPSNLPQNPSYRKTNPSDTPILMLALTSDTMTVPQMYDEADSILAQKIAQVSGVGQVFITGSSKPAVRVEANPTLLAGYGVGLEALRTAISQVNVNRPKGYFNGTDQRIAISTSDQLFGAAAYAPLIVSTDRGAVSSAAASNGLPVSVASAIAAASGSSAGATSTSSPGASSIPSASAAPANLSAAVSASAGSTAAVASSTTTFGPGSAHGTVRIQDVAEVTDSTENFMSGGLECVSMDNNARNTTDPTPCTLRPGILLMINKAPGANVIQTVDNIMEMVPRLQASVPPAMRISVALDRTTTIRASVKDVTRTLVISILLVIVVVFCFLREVRATLIPSVSVPLSLLGTFGVMYVLGYTLDNLSLMALTISTGFVVDDAIVVIENITRHLEEGLSPFEAAMVGSKEIGFTVISMSISLIAVFIPILLMGGILGRLFREFAVTLSAAIMVSLVVSLTTTPMLSAKFLKAHSPGSHGWLYRAGERALALMTAEYERALRMVLKRQPLMLVVTVATMALTVALYIVVPKGFFPQQDTGRLSGDIRGQQDVSYDALKPKAEAIAAIVAKEPGIGNTMMFLGSGGPGGGSSNSAHVFTSLADDEVRARQGLTPEKIIASLRAKTAGIPGVQLLMQSAQELNIGARSSSAQYQYTMSSENLRDLQEWGPKLLAELQKVPILKDLNTDQVDHGLQEQLVIDRDTASRLGVSPLTIDATLSDAFGQRQVSTTYMPLNQYHVVMEVAQKYQRDPDALNKIFVKSTTGTMVPLTAITHYEMRRIPLSVSHQSQTPAATISFNMQEGASLSDATLAVEQASAKIGVPATIHGGFQGTALAFQKSLSSEPILVLLALVTVYIVLGILYESYIHPLTILSTIPSAGLGALLFLLLFKTELSVIAMIGIILLIGIVKKNAIMMIDFALVAEREHGKTPEEAIFEACLLRFRPIMMTTMAALLGGLPLALGHGVGAELRRPLGITIVGGLVVSQCLTLFTTPVIYLFFDRLRARVEKVGKLRSRSRLAVAHPQPIAGD